MFYESRQWVLSTGWTQFEKSKNSLWARSEYWGHREEGRDEEILIYLTENVWSYEEQWGADEEFSLKTENSSENSSVFPQFSYVNHLTRDNHNVVRFSTNPHFLLNSSAPKN